MKSDIFLLFYLYLLKKSLNGVEKEDEYYMFALLLLKPSKPTQSSIKYVYKTFICIKPTQKWSLSKNDKTNLKIISEIDVMFYLI